MEQNEIEKYAKALHDMHYEATEGKDAVRVLNGLKITVRRRGNTRLYFVNSESKTAQMRMLDRIIAGE